MINITIIAAALFFCLKVSVGFGGEGCGFLWLSTRMNPWKKGAMPIVGYIKATYFSVLKINNSKRINAIYLKILFNASQCIFIIF